MEINRNTQHVVGWSIEKCGSFLKYVVLVSKTVAYIYNKPVFATTVFADSKIFN